MKPSLTEVRNFNKHAKTLAWNTYTKVLRSALVAYVSRTNDRTPLDLFERKAWPDFYRCIDSLSEQSYPDAALHFAANQLGALVRKYPWKPEVVNLDPEGKAIETFIAAEHRCKRMNQWFVTRRRYLRHSAFLLRMSNWIKYVVNDAPNLVRIYGRCDHSNGASLGVHGEATNLMRKLQAERTTVTPVALPYYAAAMTYNVHYAERYARLWYATSFLIPIVTQQDIRERCTLVGANKIAFVPKTAKTFRSIAVEPLGNGFIQKGADYRDSRSEIGRAHV